MMTDLNMYEVFAILLSGGYEVERDNELPNVLHVSAPDSDYQGCAVRLTPIHKQPVECFDALAGSWPLGNLLEVGHGSQAAARGDVPSLAGDVAEWLRVRMIDDGRGWAWTEGKGEQRQAMSSWRYTRR